MDGRRIVFVIGVARSGTTAMADLLNLHPEICIGIERYKFKFARRAEFDGDEFTPERFFDFRPGDTNILPSAKRWKAIYGRMRRKFPRATVVGDKIPHLFDRFEECARAFPQARWIYMLRQIDGVASSWNARAQNPEDNWPAKHDFQKAVEVWNRANALIRAVPEDRVRIVGYEDFFGGGEAARRALLDFIGVAEGPGFRKGAASAYRKYAEVVQAKPPLVLQGQEAHIAAEADMESSRCLLARARAAADRPPAAPTAPAATKLLVLGLGKSGTTALMTGVSEALGIAPLMEPKNLARVDYSRPVVVKKLLDDFSEAQQRHLERFDGIVLIVRDPRDALISRLLYRPFGLPVFRHDRAVRLYVRRIEQKIARPAAVPVRELLTLLQDLSRNNPRAVRSLVGLETLHAKCIELHAAHADRMLLCRYEDFVAGNVAELEAYLGARLPRTIAVGGQYRRVFRSGGAGAWKHWFTPEDVAYFDPLFADFYAAFGYRPETPHAEQRIERADTVDYTVRLINEWRQRRNLPPFAPAAGPIGDMVSEITRSTKQRGPAKSVYRAVRARLSALLSG